MGARYSERPRLGSEGIHQRTFELLMAQHDAYVNAAVGGMSQHLRLMEGGRTRLDSSIFWMPSSESSSRNSIYPSVTRQTKKKG